MDIISKINGIMDTEIERVREVDTTVALGLVIAKNLINEDEIAKNIGNISDGYHTFDELYNHRMILFSIVCNTYKDKAWKSWKHEDGTMYDYYFIVGIRTKLGDYTYHYRRDEWNMFDVKEIDNAPRWDGHEPKDITRLLSLL